MGEIYRHIDLRNAVPLSGSVQFVKAAVSAASLGPSFAIVYYERDGETQEYGLRLDLDKRLFLDHFEDPTEEEVIASSAPEVALAISRNRSA